MPADEDAPIADFSLEADTNLTASPFKPKAPWTKHYSGIEKKNELATLLWIPQVTRANTNLPHTPHNTQEQNKNYFVLCKRTLSPARHVQEETSYQTRPQTDAGDASLLMGSLN